LTLVMTAVRFFPRSAQIRLMFSLKVMGKSLLKIQFVFF